MKQFILVCLFLFSISALSFGQNFLEAGNTCFNAGNYQCAKENFEKEMKKNYTQVTEVKLRRSNNCLKSLTQANTFFLQKNYSQAKTAYQEVLDLNPNDTYVKQQIEKCNSNLTQVTITLNLNKSSLSFTASGGNENIYITTNSNSYTVELLPSWCAIQKYSDYFVVTCASNPLTSQRTDYFEVKAGGKSVRVYIVQAAKVETSTNTTSATLKVSKLYISFDKRGGNSESIQVYSSGPSYSISMTPSWCTIKYYTGYFIVVCEPNNSNPRSDWFYVNSGGKQVQVNVNQDGSTALNISNKYKNQNSTKLYIGVGVLKPLIFKADGRTLSNMDVGYSFTLGFVKTLGLYAKVNTNLSFVTGDYTPATLPTTYYGVTDAYSNSTFNRFGVVGGLMLKINPIILYVGAGEGHYYHFVKTSLYNYLDDSFVNTVNLTTMSFGGLETDAGLIINFNKVGISFGVSSFSFKYYEVNAGLGIRF